jgi:hypothetical protein
MIKWMLILVLIFAGFVAYAQENYTVRKSTSSSGERLISLRSNVDYYAYCHILDGRGYLVAEFYLEPYATSRRYHEPLGRWTWECI